MRHELYCTNTFCSKKYGENLMVKLIAIFVAASYIFVVVAYVCVWCRPPSDYLDPESSDGKSILSICSYQKTHIKRR